MVRVLFRLILLAGGLGATEIGLGNALAGGNPAGWALVLIIGLPMIVAGSAGFMVSLFGGGIQSGGSTDA